MPSEKQKAAAKKNIKKAQQKWKNMTPRQHSLAQPDGRARAKPGTKGEGNYFRIVVRPKSEFTSFRFHDVGEPGDILRLAGKRSSGSWDDQAWLISKDMAHPQDGTLIADSPDAERILMVVGPVKHIKGDVFEGHPRINVPEKDKPTRAQKTAQKKNIKKAQEARWA